MKTDFRGPRSKTTGQMGLWVLHIAQLIYTAKFQLLGTRDELEEIRKRY